MANAAVIERDRVDIILVDRLLELYDPWIQIDVDKHRCSQSQTVQPKFLLDHTKRGSRYHYARIRYFAKMFREGKTPTPITLDNQTSRYAVLPIPVLTDGHHRLCGADLARAEKIPASYSGRVDLLRYLKGHRKTCPEA